MTAQLIAVETLYIFLYIINPCCKELPPLEVISFLKKCLPTLEYS